MALDESQQQEKIVNASSQILFVLLLQVTTQGELVIPIESVHRKPYEPMIIGRFNLATEDGSEIAAKKARTDKPEIGVNTDDAQIPQNKVIFSIPTSVHSQKPILSGCLFVRFTFMTPYTLVPTTYLEPLINLLVQIKSQSQWASVRINT